jgi:nitrate reductase beta subunit
VPVDFLTQMFGPGVEEAIETYRNAKDDPELLGLLMLFGATERIMDTFGVEDGIATAYDEQGEPIVSVPLTEPTIVRDASYQTTAAGEDVLGFRHNT